MDPPLGRRDRNPFHRCPTFMFIFTLVSATSTTEARKRESGVSLRVARYIFMQVHCHDPPEDHLARWNLYLPEGENFMREQY